MSYVITTCSTVDLPRSYLEDRNIPCICFHYTMNGKEYADDMGLTMSSKEFYQHIRDGAMPTTSQVNVEQYISMFEPLLQSGKDVLHLGFSSALSGSVISAKMAKEQLSPKYPDRKLYVVDTLAASSGFGLLLDTAYEMKEGGTDIDTLHHWVEENKLNLHHWVRADDLYHLKRGGRVSGASAVIGTMLNIKPIINMSFEGKLIPRDKVKGAQKSLRYLVDMMEKHCDDGLEYNKKVFLCHSDKIEDAQYVAKLVEETFPKMQGNVMINDIGAVVGSHTGIGTIALFFWGDKRID